MKNKTYTNLTTIIEKKEIFNIDNLGNVQIINDRYIVPSDDFIPIGSKLHLYIPGKSKSNAKKEKVVGDKIYSGSYTGYVTRAYYSILDNFIKIEMADNYKERTTKAKNVLRRFMPNRLNEELKNEQISSKSIPVSLLNKSYIGVINGDYEQKDKYKETKKKQSKIQKQRFKKEIARRKRLIKEIKSKTNLS